MCFCVDGGFGIACGEGGCALGSRTNTERGSIGEGQALLIVVKNAAHSNAQRRRNGSKYGLLGHRESTGERGQRGKQETEDVTWGPRDSQALLKYEEIKRITLKGTEMRWDQ